MENEREADTKSELSCTLSEKQENSGADDASREMMNMALAMQQEAAMDPNHRRIESKDAMWKPAPIVGRESTTMRYGTQQLAQMQASTVLQPNTHVLGNQA